MSIQMRSTVSTRAGEKENAAIIVKSKRASALMRRPALGELSNTNVQSNEVAKDVKKKEIAKPPVAKLRHTLRPSTTGLLRPQVVPLKPTKQVLPLLRKTDSVASFSGLLTAKTAPPVNTARTTPPLSAFVEDIDKEDEGNPLLLSDYAADIYCYLRELERKYVVHADYMAGYLITHRMRSTLIDWLVDVQVQYHLLTETLHISVAIVDRFLQKNNTIIRTNLQLVGVTALFVASKYEEMHLPELSDFVYITDNAFSKREILKMEQIILKALDFNLGRPLALHFLRRYSKAAKCQTVHHALGKYFLELALVEYTLCHVSPSLISAVAIYISLCVAGDQGKPDSALWTATLAHYSTYQFTDLEPLIPKLANVILKNTTSKLQAVRKKYANSKLLAVSCISSAQNEILLKLAGL